MALILSSNTGFDNALEKLNANFPDLKVKTFKKKQIRIHKGKKAVVIKFGKKHTKVYGDLNLNDPLNMVLVILGVISGFLGLILLFSLEWLILSKQIKSLNKRFIMCLNPRKEYSINKYLDVFTKYTDSFMSKTSDENTIENIKLKINHSLRVYKNAENIAKSLNLNSQDYFIAQLCGLFHDIGRFEQFTKYKTFKDDESLYHGKLGEDVLKKEGFYQTYPILFKRLFLMLSITMD